MRISHKYKFIFLSNPQSASTTIRKLLNPFSDIRSGNTLFPHHDNEFPHHMDATGLKAKCDEMGWAWNEYFKFTTIRNPWDKMIGRYHYGLAHPKSIWHIPAKSVSTFKEFVFHPEVIRHSKQSTIKKFAFNENDECLVDYILKIEDINTELPKILNKLGLPKRKIRKLNASEHNHYSDYYDEETKDAVGKFFEFDIEYAQYFFSEAPEFESK